MCISVNKQDVSRLVDVCRQTIVFDSLRGKRPKSSLPRARFPIITPSVDCQSKGSRVANLPAE